MGANKSYLIKNSAVKAKELDIHRLVLLPHRAYVEHLTGRLEVRVVAANHLAGTREIRFREVIEVQILKLKTVLLDLVPTQREEVRLRSCSDKGRTKNVAVVWKLIKRMGVR